MVITAEGLAPVLQIVPNLLTVNKCCKITHYQIIHTSFLSFDDSKFIKKEKQVKIV